MRTASFASPSRPPTRASCAITWPPMASKSGQHQEGRRWRLQLHCGRSGRPYIEYVEYVKSSIPRSVFWQGHARIADLATHHSPGFTIQDRGRRRPFLRRHHGPPTPHGLRHDRHQSRWSTWRVPDGTDWLEYMLKPAPPFRQKTRGVMNHIALGVPDVKAAYQNLRIVGPRWTPAEDRPRTVSGN